MPERHKKTAIKLIASPGGGKGTTEDGLRKRGISYRELPFRAKLDREVDGKTDIGKEIDKYRKAGLLVPNETILPLVDEALEEIQESNLIILDGFPRNLPQVDFSIERLRHFGFENIIALHIDTPPFTCVRRLAGRKRDSQDSDPENIAQRLEEFDFQTAPMIRYLRHNAEKLGIKFFMIDGQNLRMNMDDYIRMLGLDWMVKK